MFKSAGPRVFAVPVGADFPAQLVQGLRERMADQPPEAMAKVQVLVNTARMLRRVRQVFAASGASFLPRLSLITQIADMPLLDLPQAVSPLRRRLELAQLVSALLEAEPKLAPRHAVFDLADSLARLMDEIQSEGLHPDVIAAVDVSNHAEHWTRTQRFLAIIGQYLENRGMPDADARQLLAVDRLAARWHAKPPEHPVLIAGSTGSRGTTLRLMEAVAALPQGALILPGYDDCLPQGVWGQMTDALTAEDHPQYRFRRVMDRMGIEPGQIGKWTATPAPAPDRNSLISLALRPAPVTDQWLTDGPDLPDLLGASAGMTLISAPSPRTEALAVALVLRDAAERGVTAALISPDRTLTRQVTAVLDRWGILPDDSAGKPLALSPPGRFLRQIAALFGEKLTSDRLLALLKHPLTASGGDRGTHLRFTRDLELSLRRYGPAFPSPDSLRLWAAAHPDGAAMGWAGFIAQAIDGLEEVATRSLREQAEMHFALAESLARGTAESGAGGLWDKAAGKEALAQMQVLLEDSIYGGTFSASEYRGLFSSFIAKGEVREPVQSHPKIMIWGTLEARVQGADLVVLGGLNDGVWPKQPDPDPWLNRRMRKEAGLLLPERQIGLSAHDFQQAVGAPEVVLSRAVRDAEAETVPSRWLNRLFNLMEGLPKNNGPQALAEMQARGAKWLSLAKALDAPPPAMAADPGLQPATRPAPRPPIAARPNRLSLTRIKTLIRDPFVIYARYVLRLMPLDPLRAAPDARERGNILHLILERFVKERPADEPRAAARRRLMAIAAQVLEAETPFPAARLLWLARMDRAADHFLTQESKNSGTPLVLETQGSKFIEAPGFTLFGIPDRIDRLPDGSLHLIDYKSGAAPSKDQQKHFEKQLLLAAAMVERDGFEGLRAEVVSLISYISLGAGEKAVDLSAADMDLDMEWAKFVTLISRYARRETGYAARRALFEVRFEGDYDHLARFGEWQMSARAVPVMVGDPEETP